MPVDEYVPYEITRDDLVAGAGFDPATFSGARVLRILSGGLKRASTVYLLALDPSESSEEIVGLFTKPTKRLLDECEFTLHSSDGPLLVYARQIAGEGSELADRLLGAAVPLSRSTPSLGPFSEEAVTPSTNTVLRGFRAVVECAGREAEIIGLAQTSPR